MSRNERLFLVLTAGTVIGAVLTFVALKFVVSECVSFLLGGRS